ncbi:MAG: DUF1772 domain-containing protein [Silicimonas sp.]|nr:DUF1772 domain-containing protein [Silicimonas sp.]
MTYDLAIYGLLALSLATGLVAGVFLTFSDFVMPSLAASAPAAGTQAMQIINRKVYRSIFMVLLIGMIPVSVIAAGTGWATGLPVAGWLIAAAGLYLVGVLAVSALGNIPMNERLEALPEGGPEAQAYWPAYVAGWVRWNHLRWITATASAGCYLVGAVELAKLL